MNFLLQQGGIGDYLCAIPAIRYVADNHPNVVGEIFVFTAMVDLVAHLMKDHFPKWKVSDRTKVDMSRVPHQATMLPSMRPVNATGMHLLDLGFIYYAGFFPPPEDYNWYPKVDLSDIANEEIPMECKYAVLTPGATTKNRTMPAKAFNGIKDHLIDCGITPMFLGRKSITETRNINYEEGYNYEGGIDLREKTTLLQAAGLMSKASLVIGLDNGLLHLAACTEVPILFGYNIASPEHRRPRRKSGNIWEIYPDPKVLSCTFCQSNMRFAFDHDFANCLYKDNKCLDLLSDPKQWCEKIDQLLEKCQPAATLKR